MEWFPYELRLVKPVQMPFTGLMTHRRGVLIHDPSTGGWGDAAPLGPGAEAELQRVLATLESGDWTRSSDASLRFALECASMPWRGGGAEVRLNVLWLAESESVEALLERLREWRDPVVKIKPGSSPNPDEWHRLLEARSDLRIRIDPNRAWTLESLRQFTSGLEASRLDYVEEPLRDPALYRELDRPGDPAIALDESLRESGGEVGLLCPRLHAFVVKPTLVGNAEDRRFWVEQAEVRGIKLIWSSSLESGVGLWQLARLAAGGEPAGLDTASWWEEDLVDPRPISGNGRLLLPDRLGVSPL